MARPKKTTSQLRTRQFNVGLSPDELTFLMEQSRQAGLRPVDYARAVLLSKGKIVARPERKKDDLRLELVRIGVNLNQSAKHLNSNHPIMGRDLARAFELLNQTLERAQ